MDDLARTVVEDTLEQDLPALMIAQASKDAAADKGTEAGKGAAADVDANAGTGADTNAGASTLAETLDSPLYAREFEHVCLIASANSTPALQSMLKAALSKIWCNALGIELGRLAKEDRVIFEFCLGGVFSLLAFRHDAGFDISMGAMLKTDFARKMLASVESLSTPRASGSSL